MEKEFDIAIIGAGPAGLTAAITAKTSNPKLKIGLIEKMDEPGKKLSASGNGRGNLSNRRCESLKEVLNFFVYSGIALREDEAGRLYPYSEEAKSVTRALELKAKSLGITLLTNANVSNVEVDHVGGFHIFVLTKDKEMMVTSKKVLIATGGKSFAAYGSTGDGYILARKLGHNVTPLIPALTGIEVKENLSDIKGVRAKAEVALMQKGEIVFRETGEVQFKGDSVSGICIMNMSSQLPVANTAMDNSSRNDEAEAFANPLENCKIIINLVPDFKAPDLISFLREKSLEAGILAGDLLGTFVKKPLIKKILEDAAVEESKKASELDMAEILSIMNALRCLTLSPCGRKGWKEAQVTKGGVCLDELDETTMESKIIKNLYFAGEVTDYDGPCGGFNLHNAWLTGLKAGRAMAE